MKNLLYCFIILPCFINAQENCQGSFTEYYLNSNNIRASFFPRGNKFTDGNAGGFLAPYPSEGKLSTIFASTPWMAGIDDAGNLKMVAERYPNPQNSDFSVGPLTSIGVPYYNECANFDKAWSVFREDILLHIEDYAQDFKIDDTIPSIFGWPGRGNKYFSRFNGFELPGNDNLGLADFFDTNGNNVYDPDAGDYPALNLPTHSIIPDQMIWMVFNDVDTINPYGHRPIRMEFQLTAFAFHCEDKVWLNNTIFSKYKIIYRGVTPLDSTFFGFWTDYDLGCSMDDFIGADSARRTEFVYNADRIDGDSGVDCTTGSATYPTEPPVQSMTWLSHPMHSFVTQEYDTGFPPDKYNLLSGFWGDGSPIRPEGDGYNTDPSLTPTKFLFNGDPRVPNEWAAINVFDEGKEQRSVSSISLGRINPGFFTNIYTAHMFHYDPNADHLGQITHMYNNVDSLLAMFWHPHIPFCTPVQTCMDGDCVWPGDFNRDGIVDQRDLLHWATSIGTSGSERNGLISWRGHFAEDWTKMLEDGTNAKHLDANGDGIIDFGDLNMNIDHYLNTTPDYKVNDRYPGGPEIMIVAEPMDQEGNIGDIRVISRRPLKDMYGIAFELEFDTFYYDYSTLLHRLPLDTLGLTFIPGENHHPPYYSFYKDSRQGDTRYSFVGINQENYSIPDGFTFMRIPFGLKNQHQVPLPYLPDQFVLRLKNLTVINKDGEDLEFGSVPLTVYNPFTTSVDHPEIGQVKVFPNPCHDRLMIVTEYSSDVDIVDLHGRKVRTLEASEISIPIDVSDLLAGMYVLRFLQSGNVVKLIVQ